MPKYLIALTLILSACGSDIYSKDNGGLDSRIMITPHSEGWAIQQIDSQGIEVNFISQLSGDFIPTSANDCPKTFSSPITIKTEKTIELAMGGGNTPRRICIPALGVDTETFPGMMQGQTVTALKPGKYCGVCQLPDGSYDLKSTIVFEFKE